MENEKKATKISLNLSEKSITNIESLSKIIQEDNRTRIIASALEIAKAIMQQVEKKKHVILRTDDGKEEEMRFIIG